MKIFLTGGTGFIGSHVVKELSKQRHSITVLARNPDKVVALKELNGIDIIQGGINDASVIQDNMKGMDTLIHIALHWGNAPLDMLLNDTHSSVQLFDIAAKEGVKNIIYTSSTAVNDWVYMNNEPEETRIMTVYEETKQRPASYYGATKGASELYMNAIAHNLKIRANTIRPGYTYGNPAVHGGDIQSDMRFKDIVKKAVNNEKIELIKNDGTQFIDADDLAKIYTAIINSEVKNRMYFGLSATFTTWERIAREAVKIAGSKSEITIKDEGWSDNPTIFDVSSIEKDFGLKFDGWDKIPKHLEHLVGIYS